MYHTIILPLHKQLILCTNIFYAFSLLTEGRGDYLSLKNTLECLIQVFDNQLNSTVQVPLLKIHFGVSEPNFFYTVTHTYLDIVIHIPVLAGYSYSYYCIIWILLFIFLYYLGIIILIPVLSGYYYSYSFIICTLVFIFLYYLDIIIHISVLSE